MDKREEPKKDEPIRLDMTFEQALKKALSTPKPKKVKTAKKEFFSFTPQFTFTASIVFFTLIFAAYLTSEYIKFNSPPKLKIEAPHEAVLGSYIEVSGNTDPESAVRINQDLVIVDQNGNFNKKVLVNNTNTKIFVESKSPSGKVTTQEMIVNSR